MFDAGSVSSWAGSGKSGSADGVGTSASFNCPIGMAIDQQTGTLFVAETGNHLIRKISPQGICVVNLRCCSLTVTQGEVSTIAGSGNRGFSDGIGKSAILNNPIGVYFDGKDQSLIICDLSNNKLRKMDLQSGMESQPFSFSITASHRKSDHNL